LIRQKPYIERKIIEFGLQESNGSELPMEKGFHAERNQGEMDKRIPYKQILGSLIYAMSQSRPDIAFSVGFLSRYMDGYSNAHWEGAKRVLKYLGMTKDFWLRYEQGNGEVTLSAYVDADFGGCKETRKSTTGFVIMLGNGAVMWRSRKQVTVALSSAEAEYVAASEAVRSIIWLRSILAEIGFEQKGPTTVFENNNACIAIGSNLETKERSKHIDIKYHFVREKIASCEICFRRIDTKEQIADVLTKALDKTKLEKFRENLGVKVYLNRGSVEDSNGSEEYPKGYRGNMGTNPRG
jgi:hypothetical protein